MKDKLSNDPTVFKVNHYHKNIKKIIENVFDSYDAIIAIMATGIVIRSISPFIKSKTIDPAILNIDDNGRFVISLLSGHLGGSNKLTEKVSSLINATPVITTSTDINHRLGIDTLAKDLYFTLEEYDNIVHINKAILEGKQIVFRINKDSNFDFLNDYLNNNTLEIDVLFEFSEDVSKNQIEVIYNNHIITLKKEKIVIGIGCKRGKTKEEIIKAIKKALTYMEFNIKRINKIASASIKEDEKGLIELSDYLNIPIDFIDIDLIKEFDFNNISTSEFVKSKFGIKGVCEPAALISAGNNSELIFKKTAYDGVTIAFAKEKLD